MSGGKTETYTPSLCEKMRALVSYADILTPNLTELCSLTGSDYRDGKLTPVEIENMCKTLAEQGPEHIVVTGIHYSSKQIMNFVYSLIEALYERRENKK